jgi:flagellin
MSLGVLNNIAAIYAQNNLNQTQGSLQNTLQQLSSGSRINSGADDAAGLSVADGLGANVSALTQSQQNAKDGTGLLQTADGALSQVTNLLNRAVTLATEAANGTLNTNQVSSANQEYQNILTEIENIGATTNFNGNTVFTNSAKTVFVSDGTASGANSYSEVVGSLSSTSVGITAPITASNIALTAAAVSGTAANGGTTPATFTTTAVGAAGTAAVETLTAGAAGDSFSAGSYTLSYAGNSTTVSVTQGQTIAQVRADFNTQLAAAGSNFAGLTVGTASSTAFTVTGTAGGTNQLTIVSGGTAVNDQNAAGGTAQTSTLTFASQSDVVTGSLILNSGTGTATTFTATVGQTAAQFATAISANTGAGYTASFGTGASANILTITGHAGAGNGLSATSNLVDVVAAAGQTSGVDFGISSVSQLTSQTAQTVLTTVTTAIADVAFQRGVIGANVNELTAASNVSSAESVNLTSAQSSILSTNYGTAASNLAKYQVLSQAGISALAQANSVQNEVLKLLQ